MAVIQPLSRQQGKNLDVVSARKRESVRDVQMETPRVFEALCLRGIHLQEIEIMQMRPAVVIDMGSYSTRVGEAGTPAPSLVFPTAIACDPHPDRWWGHRALRPRVVGWDAIEMARLPLKEGETSRCSLGSPVQDGLVICWDQIESILDYIFSKITNVDLLPQTPVLCTERPLDPMVLFIYFAYTFCPLTVITPRPTVKSLRRLCLNRTTYHIITSRPRLSL